MSTRPLSREALTDGNVVDHARALIGVELHSWIDGIHAAGRVVETEAYRGADDKAAHSYGYKRTARTDIFFGAAGHAYVYLIYGLHSMFNVVTGPRGQPDAVLVRAIEPLFGTDAMLARRKLPSILPRIGNGPALVCQALAITRHHYGVDLLAGDAVIQLRGVLNSVAASAIIAGPRVGVAYSEECAAWPWRFRESGNPYTSPAK